MSSNTQAHTTLSDVLARLECELNQFQFATQTLKARAAALATVDQNIEAARRLTRHRNTVVPVSILCMLTRRNMLAPISILPMEILALIFHFVAFSESHYSRDWFHFTHVCQHWRQVALDDSTLWTDFSALSGSKHWIAKQLSRAKNAPLVVDPCSWPTRWSDILKAKTRISVFIPHISHTRELYLRDMSFVSSERKIVQEIGTKNAPALERLELGVNDVFLTPIERVVGCSFFKRPLPKLRILCLSQILFPWSLFPRGQLTQLKVTFLEEVDTVNSKDSQQDDLDQLIDLLLDCPSLEVLTLDNCLPAMLSKSLGGHTIHLPRLSRLCLSGSSSRITNFFKMLKLSSSTTLRLNCESEKTATHNHDDYHIFPFLSAHFNDPTPVKFRSFEINVERRVIEMAAYSSLKSPYTDLRVGDVVPAHIDPELSLTFRRIAKLNRVDIPRRACNMLSLSNLEFLSVDFDSCHSPNQLINWSEGLQYCTEVTTIQISGRGTTGILQALKPPKGANMAARRKGGTRKCDVNRRGARAQVLDDDDESDGPAPLHVTTFPKLTSLLLSALDFADLAPGFGILYDLVLSAVQWRKANNTPLMTLGIRHCDISKKQAKTLEEVVCEFRWDCWEGYYRGTEGDREPKDYDTYSSDSGDDHSDTSDPGVQ